MAWFRTRATEPPPQDRYAGKPFLKLVDSFILKCIGELAPSNEALLEQMTPKLRQTFGHAGTWDEIVEAQLGFKPGVRDGIRDLWDRNQEIARQNGVTLTPMQFTEMFVASNIPDA